MGKPSPEFESQSVPEGQGRLQALAEMLTELALQGFTVRIGDGSGESLSEPMSPLTVVTGLTSQN